MAGAMHKTLEYLGFGPQVRHEDDYDDQAYDEDYADDATAAPATYAPVTPLRRSAHDVMAPTHVGGLSRITTIHPRTYNEARTIGENFRDGVVPVIMNLTDMSDADAKRLVDFAAGLVFGLHGEIERVTNKVFLLSPQTVEINTEDSVVAPGRGVFNQS